MDANGKQTANRAFDLFEALGMEKKPLHQHTKDGSLIPYYMKNGVDVPIEPWCYNDITLWGGEYDAVRMQSADSDPFNMATDGSIPEEYGTIF